MVNSGGYYHDSHHSGHRDSGYYNSHRNQYSRHSSGWFSTIIMWGIIAWIVYYIYQRLTHDPSQQNNSFGGHSQSARPPPPGFRPEYVPGDHTTYSSSQAGDAGTASGGGFWSGAATGGLLGYLFGSSGRHNTYYDHHGYYGPRQHRRWPGYGFGGGSNWFGSNNSWSSGWTSGSSYRGSPSSPSTRTTSGFGGTKRR